MILLGIVLRGLHLAASSALIGAFLALLVAGRPTRPTAEAWEARVMAAARRLVLLALASGLATLAHQVVVLEGRAGALLELTAVTRFFGTQAGLVWLARHGLLAVLGAFLALRLDTRRRPDWLAARGEGMLLGAVALGLLAVSGHAAAVEPGTARAIAIDAVHVVAAGVWLGALPPLGALLLRASDPGGEDARAYAVVAVRRFSGVALGLVLLLGVTGLANAATHVASVAGLVGTPYGRLLLAKLALVAPILLVALVNRRRLVPALSGEAARVGRPAMRRLARFITVEAGLGLVVLGVAAAMAVTAPARHAEAIWPFSFRLTLVHLADAPALQWRFLVGSQIVVLGVVAVVAAVAVPRLRAVVALAGTVVAAAGASVALPAIAIDAYPTTYLRPAVPYHATSIVAGQVAYREHCQTCHGPAGAGDGPAARALPYPPADLRAPHTGDHTAGDLFWWITHGIAGRGMPGFAEQLDEMERWDVINFVRLLGATAAARALGPSVEPGRSAIVAPDFTFAVGAETTRTLRDYRGEKLVLVVLYTLPDSRPRLAQLAAAGRILGLLGAEVIAVPRNASPDAIRELGPEPRFLFPVVTEGAAEIVETYSLFAPTSHAELLVDRGGYLRAVLEVGPGEPGDINALLAEIQQLNEEPATAPAADEHVH